MNKGISAPGTGILLALPRLVLRSPLILLYARRRRADGRQGLNCTLAPNKGTLAPSKGILATNKGILAPSKSILAMNRNIFWPNNGMLLPNKGILAPNIIFWY